MEHDPELCDAANIIASLNKEFGDLQDENAILRNNILHITRIVNKPEVLINTKEEWNNSLKKMKDFLYEKGIEAGGTHEEMSRLLDLALATHVSREDIDVVLETKRTLQ